MRLLKCPKCSKTLNPPFKSSKRQVCTGCGWSSKSLKRKAAKRNFRNEIAFIVVITLIFTIKIVMHNKYQEYIDRQLYYREVFTDPELYILDYVNNNINVWIEREETAISNMANSIFMRNMSVGDKIAIKERLHEKGEIVSIPYKKNQEIEFDEVGIKLDNSIFENIEEYKVFGISPAELIVIDPSTGEFVLTVEDFKEEAKKEVARINQQEEIREIEYIKISDKMMENFSPGQTVIPKNFKAKGIVTEVNKNYGLIEVQWEEINYYKDFWQKPEDLKIINPNTNTVLWQAPLL